ncbi:uncharacterized protein LOC125779122 [Bactrocera dorsalis]|uniref:Putative nuclease HARBI1 n=1 Tax=Bactrocera dorsalis TaxID=27457 RepID=A0A034WMH4_BACDO|nr:uncharacterized protein LOC125779122 [Bactrocera dorsalis]
MDYLKKKKVAVALLTIATLKLKKKNQKRKTNPKQRSIWVRNWLERRNTNGAYETTLREFREVDNQKFLFKNYVRMNENNFNELLQLISPLIKKKDTCFREAIPASHRLACTLRFLATGDSYKSLSAFFRIAPNTISKFVPEVCDAIYSQLRNTYLKIPSTKEEWTEVASKFDLLWNFPNCIGAVDGKHVVMIAPAKSGSTFYNYKGTHSIVLMAVVDASYKYLYIDVGCNGRISDGGVFSKCSLQYALDTDSLNLPPPRHLLGREMNVPFVLVADDAFKMQNYLMKPYPGRILSGSKRIFNYRLSRARRIVENAFGIMMKRFEIFSRPMKLNPNKTTRVTLACCALHNFLMTKNISYATGLVDSCTEDGNIIEGARVNISIPTFESATEDISISYISNEAKTIREEFENYFMSPDGELPWQYKFI